MLEARRCPLRSWYAVFHRGTAFDSSENLIIIHYFGISTAPRARILPNRFRRSLPRSSPSHTPSPHRNSQAYSVPAFTPPYFKPSDNHGLHDPSISSDSLSHTPPSPSLSATSNQFHRTCRARLRVCEGGAQCLASSLMGSLQRTCARCSFPHGRGNAFDVEYVGTSCDGKMEEL